ncbi:unnamed protein product [Microthlaspi erraticum]|uniref:Uncharacterized protein n=1 Tax=Microthlaspi erraticum TaxID=1685480 RepID=A0A6D2HYB2_9BRAS|nr:unnamed protein product [Microthlaspi erraticum]
MEMEEEKDLPLLLGTPFLSTVGASIDFHKQEVILHKVNSLVSYRLQPRGCEGKVDKEPRVVRDKVEKDKGVDKGPRIEKPRLERARVENHVTRSQLDRQLDRARNKGNSIEFHNSTKVFWSIWSIWDVRGARKDLVHGRSSTGYAKEEGGSHLEDQLDHSGRVPQLDRPSFNSIELRSQQSNPKNVASPLTFL